MVSPPKDSHLTKQVSLSSGHGGHVHRAGIEHLLGT